MEKFRKTIEEFKTGFIKPQQLNSFFKINCKLFKKFCKDNIKDLVKNFNSKNPASKLKIKEDDWEIFFP